MSGLAAGDDGAGDGAGPPLPEPALADRRARALVEHSIDLVMIVDAEGRMRFTSPSFERHLGLRPADLRDTVGFSWLHPDDVEGARALFGEVVAGTDLTTPTAFRMRRADGGWLTVEAVASNHLDDEAVRGVVVTARPAGDRLLLEREASRIDALYHTLISSLAYGVLVADANGFIVLCNDALEQIFGAPRHWLVGRHLESVVAQAGDRGLRVLDEAGRPVAVEQHPLLETLRTGEPRTGVVHMIERPAADTTVLRINSRIIPGPDGTRSGVVASFADITMSRRSADALRTALRALQMERTFLQVILDNVGEGIVACDANGRVTVVNPAGRRLLGITGDSPLGAAPANWGLTDLEGMPVEPEDHPLQRVLSGHIVRDVELLVRGAGGEPANILVNGCAMYDDRGREIGAVIAVHDVTAQRRTEQHLTQLALHDPLTGLANRILLDDRLGHSLERVRRGGGGVGVLLLDLDQFKEVNDEHGHDIGDEVLEAVARRLQAVVRPPDTVARYGGDEFVIVCEVSGGQDEVDGIARRVEEALAAPYWIEAARIEVPASVGRVLSEAPDVDPADLLAAADRDMYRAKWERRPRNRPGAPDGPGVPADSGSPGTGTDPGTAAAHAEVPAGGHPGGNADRGT